MLTGTWIVKMQQYIPQMKPELNVNLQLIKERVKILSGQSGNIYLSFCLLGTKNGDPDVEVKGHIYLQGASQHIQLAIEHMHGYF